jgi:hypothetical protein
LALPGVTKLCYREENIAIQGLCPDRYYIDDYNLMEAFVNATGSYSFPRPLFMSKGGQVMHDHSQYLYLADKFGSDEIWDFWTTFGQTIPVLRMFGILSDEDFTNILEEVGVLDSVDILTDQPIETIPTARDAPLPENRDFWTWREHYFELPDYLENIYRIADQCLKDYMLWKSVSEMASDRGGVALTMIGKNVPKEGSGMDILIKRLTRVCGTTYKGVYCYSIPDTFNEVFGGSDSSDVGGFDGGLFD